MSNKIESTIILASEIIAIVREQERITKEMIEAGLKCIAIREQMERDTFIQKKPFCLNCQCFDCFINKNYYS